MLATVLLVLSFLQAPQSSCTWGTPREVGALGTVVNESSGMAVSRRYPDRTYRINDSGDIGRFFVVDQAGTVTKIVHIPGFNPLDTEDLAVGPCGNSVDCIFIGDIGDNNRQRQTIEL